MHLPLVSMIMGCGIHQGKNRRAQNENSSEFSIKTNDNTFNGKPIIRTKGIFVSVAVCYEWVDGLKSKQNAEAINLATKRVSLLLQSETRMCACPSSVCGKFLPIGMRAVCVSVAGDSAMVCEI